MRAPVRPLFKSLLLAALAAPLILTTSCGKKAEAPKAAKKKAEAPKAAEKKAEAPKAEAKKAEVAKEDAKIKVAMSKHNHAALAIRDHLVIGDLNGAKPAAEWLATYKPEQVLEEAAKPTLAAMQAAAKQVAEANDIATASKALGGMVATCGSCHATVKGGVKFPPPVPPVPEGTVKAHMKGHFWGVSRLWDGLIGPDDKLWKAGSHALKDGEGLPTMFADLVKTKPELKVLVASVGKQADTALAASEPKARAEALGGLLGTCGSCHKKLGAGPRATAVKWP